MMNPCLVKCPECKGKVWVIPNDMDFPSHRKIKCELCDDEGMAHIDDLIDYYSYMSPNETKQIRWQAYKEMNTEENPTE